MNSEAYGGAELTGVTGWDLVSVLGLGAGHDGHDVGGRLDEGPRLHRLTRPGLLFPSQLHPSLPAQVGRMQSRRGFTRKGMQRRAAGAAAGPGRPRAPSASPIEAPTSSSAAWERPPHATAPGCTS